MNLIARVTAPSTPSFARLAIGKRLILGEKFLKLG